MEFLCLRIPPGPLLVSTGGWILAGSPSSSSPDLTCMLISRSVTGNMMIVLDFTKCYWATDLLGVAVLLLLLKLLLILLSKKRTSGDVVTLHHVIVVLNRRFAMFVSLLLCQIFYAYRVPQKKCPIAICSREPIVLFHMCFGIRILSLFLLNTLNIPIQNIKCPKNTKNACADITMLSCVPLLRDLGLFLNHCKPSNFLV